MFDVEVVARDHFELLAKPEFLCFDCTMLLEQASAGGFQFDDGEEFEVEVDEEPEVESSDSEADA
jgi:hypothetical protein